MNIYEAGHLNYLRRYTFSAPSHFMLFRMKDNIMSAAPHISAHMKQKIGSNIFFHKEHIARRFYIITSLHFTYNLHIRFFLHLLYCIFHPLFISALLLVTITTFNTYSSHFHLHSAYFHHTDHLLLIYCTLYHILLYILLLTHYATFHVHISSLHTEKLNLMIAW